VAGQSGGKIGEASLQLGGGVRVRGVQLLIDGGSLSSFWGQGRFFQSVSQSVSPSDPPQSPAHRGCFLLYSIWTKTQKLRKVPPWEEAAALRSDHSQGTWRTNAGILPLTFYFLPGQLTPFFALK